ncbi:hypothetical protein BJ138DRAFT_406823 [Hygrophoropsis aurantiaca]|uniref:Uncharacterized protein n=1 Tax=Hygrophoropsis aurantiaca TaxID=72124 RepID=A0ACB8A5Q8_9AGAM|nr:hypothetical protein BJ138DRAFT_406823 [Hygrophoropsis aurantiaca]
MNREDKSAPFDDLPTLREVAAFDSTKGRCCTPSRFRVDLTDVPRSEWNRSAAQVFAADFIATYPNGDFTTKQVVNAWFTHFDSLKITYKSLILKQKADKHSLRALEAARAAKRRQERKNNLYLRRHQVAKRYGTVRTLALPIVQQLGVDGMSSDESDHEAGHGEASYVIKRKVWRAKAISTWLRTLDSLHLRARYKGEWKASSGAWPHLRMTSTTKSERKAVPGLPKNFYSKKWINQLDEFESTDLQCRGAAQDLSVPREVKKLAKPYDLSSHKVVRGGGDPDLHNS